MTNNLLGEFLAFSLLGRLIYNLPEKTWLETLINEDVFSEMPYGEDRQEVKAGLKTLGTWAERHKQGLDESVLKDLKADFTRLFVGGKQVKAPPWESVYFTEDRLIFQEQTLQVRSWYRRFGLEPEKLHQEPDDHIGLEMSFVAHLAELGLNAQEEGDQETVEDLAQAKIQFLSEHLLVWGPRWCELVAEYSATEFYRGLSDLTLGVFLEAGDQYGIEISGD